MTEPAKRRRLRSTLMRLEVRARSALILLRDALIWLATKIWLALLWLRRKLTPSIETRQLMLKAAGRALLGVGLILWNPLDLFHKADEASSNAFQYFMAGFIHHNVQQPKITVVLFTPTALKRINEALEPDPLWAWPITFEDQKTILHKIANYKPLAIFYDIEFYQERGSESLFQHELAEVTRADEPTLDCRVRDMRSVHGIPVLLAQPPAPQKILKQFCNAGTVAANVLWNGRPNIYPFMGYRAEPLLCKNTNDLSPNCVMDKKVAAVLNRACSERSLSLQDCLSEVSTADLLESACAEGKIETTRCFMPTSAAALHKWLCDTHQLLPDRCFGPKTLPEPKNLINLVWRNNYDDSQAGDNDALAGWRECARPRRGGPPNQAGSEAENLVTTCPSPNVVFADQIMLAKTSQGKEQQAEVFRHSIVLIGAEFPGMRDRIDTPYFGRVPGAFSHLAALDNLDDWGPNYIHAEEDERLLTWAHLGQFVIVATLLFSIMYVIEWLRKYAPSLAHLAHEHEPANKKHGYDAALVLAAILVLIAGTAAVLLGISAYYFFCQHQAPLNWIGELAIVWVFAFEETLYALLLVLLVFPLFSKSVRAFACHLVEKPPEGKHHA